jgi:hypothetical protein
MYKVWQLYNWTDISVLATYDINKMAWDVVCFVAAISVLQMYEYSFVCQKHEWQIVRTGNKNKFCSDFGEELHLHLQKLIKREQWAVHRYLCGLYNSKIGNITDNKQFSCLIVQAPEDSKTEHDTLKPKS